MDARRFERLDLEPRTLDAPVLRCSFLVKFTLKCCHETHGNRISDDDVQSLIEAVSVCNDFVVREGSKNGPHNTGASVGNIPFNIADCKAGFVAICNSEE